MMDGWEGQNWLHRDKGRVIREGLVGRTRNIIALRSRGDEEVLCGTRAGVSASRHVKHGVWGRSTGRTRGSGGADREAGGNYPVSQLSKHAA